MMNEFSPSRSGLSDPSQSGLSLEENPLLLSLIIQKVDDNTLANLFLAPGLQETIKKELGDDYFWYLRTKTLTRRELIPRNGANWRDIYQVLKLDKDEAFKRSLDNLDKMKVFIEVYGPLDLKRGFAPREVWQDVQSLDVLKYLLDSKYLSVDEAAFGLFSQAEAGRLDIVKFILTLPEVDRDEYIKHALNDAARGGHPDVVKLLLGRSSEGAGDALLEASKKGNPEVVRLLLEYPIPDRKLAIAAETAAKNDRVAALKLILKRIGRSFGLLKSALVDAAERGSTDVVRAYLESNVKTTLTSIKTLFSTAIRNNHYNLTKYLLTRVSPATEGNQALKLAAELRDPAIFQLILEDSRIDLNSDLLGLIRSTSYLLRADKKFADYILTGPRISKGYNSDIISQYRVDLIVQDERVDLNRVDTSVIRTLEWAIAGLIQDRIQGLITAEDSVGSDNVPSVAEVLDWIEKRSDTYSQLLCFIIIKRPSGEDLLKWILKHRDRYSREAARSLLEGRIPSAEAIPVWSLMLHLLDVNLKQIVDILEEEDVGDEEIVFSARLIGAYSGEASGKFN